MTWIHDLPTPAAVVDLPTLERNCRRMQDRAELLEVRLRPHVKTHKTAEIALLQCGGQPGPVTVSTLAEAEYLASAGFRDITYAVPLDLSLVPRAIDLAGRIDRLNLLVDHLDTVQALEGNSGPPLPVFLKVDCGYHRAGVDPDSGEALNLAGRIHEAGGIEFAGLLTHAGHAYRGRSRGEILEIAGQERDAVAGFAARLRSEGIPSPTVSVGSTPTMAVVDHLQGVDEIRPGNYVFHDRFQAAVGACAPDHIAFTVLGTVIGVYPERGRFLLNTGALALSRDPGADHIDPAFGFGQVLAADEPGGSPLGRIVSISQEHGVVQAAGTLPKIGTRVRVLPNHSCLAAALFDRYHAVRGDRVEGRFVPCRGW